MPDGSFSTQMAPTPAGVNVPGSLNIQPNPAFAAESVYLDQLAKYNFQTEHFLAADKETLTNDFSNYNRTLQGLGETENKGYQGLAYRNEREGLINSGFAQQRRQALAGQYTDKRGALAERLNQNLRKVERGVQEREGGASKAGAEYSLAAQKRAEAEAARRALEAPQGTAGAGTPGGAYPGATATVNAAFPGGEAEHIRYVKAMAKGEPFVRNPGGTPQRAKGGPVTPGHAYLVGEAGPELVVPKTPGRVIPNQRLQAIRKAAALGRYKR